MSRNDYKFQLILIIMRIIGLIRWIRRYLDFNATKNGSGIFSISKERKIYQLQQYSRYFVPVPCFWDTADLFANISLLMEYYGSVKS